LQACRFRKDQPSLRVSGVECGLGGDGPAERGETLYHEAVEAGKSWLGGYGGEDGIDLLGGRLDVWAAPGVDHADEDGEGEFGGWEVGGILGKMFDGGDDGGEGGLVG